MKPLREDPQTAPELSALLEAARAVPEATPAQEAAVWRRIRETADARKLQRRSPWPIAAPALAAFALTVLVAPRLSRGPDPLAVAHVEPGPGASVEVQGEAVALRQGSLRAGPQAHVRTPQLDVQVGVAHCRIQVAGEVTTVDVQDGEVRVRRGEGPVVVLSGGTRLRSDDPRLAPVPLPAPVAPAAPPQPAPVSDACAALAPDARTACYTRLAMGDDLAAQNALYMLGQQEREAHRASSAIQYWRAYEQRFPQGALWPEAAAGILTARLDQADWAGALAAAEAYLARVDSGGRSPEVKLIRANLLREHLGQPRAALEGYRALAQSDAPASVRGEALFGQALAARQLGLGDEARAALDAYARDFPAGPHAADVARMRAP